VSEPRDPQPPTEGEDQDAGEAARAARRRARRRAEVFGEVLPESTRDDRDPQAPAEGDAAEEWLKRQVPPHHG
jgi:hypothetical protein